MNSIFTYGQQRPEKVIKDHPLGVLETHAPLNSISCTHWYVSTIYVLNCLKNYLHFKCKWNSSSMDLTKCGPGFKRQPVHVTLLRQPKQFSWNLIDFIGKSDQKPVHPILWNLLLLQLGRGICFWFIILARKVFVAVVNLMSSDHMFWCHSDFSKIH
jgi:hypothetical protein